MNPTSNSQQNKAFTIKRILRDIQEIKNDAISCVSVCIPNSQNPFYLRANVMIQDGPYKDVLIPLIIRLPPNYPLSPPAANIVPGHPFTRRFHEHVIGWGENGASICTDLLSNFSSYFQKFELDGKPIVSGWSPVYTLSSILMQLQIFFADPDLPPRLLPSTLEIETMKNQARNFTFRVRIQNENLRKIKIKHSYDKPYPPFLHKDSNNTVVTAEKKAEEVPKQEQSNSDSMHANAIIYISPNKLMLEICNKLVCPVTKNTIFSNPMPQFGYPIFIKIDEFNRLWPTPIIEIISQEGLEYYAQQSSQITYHNKTGNYTSVFGQEYNYWLPLYINQQHFAQTKEKIFETITKLYKKISPQENPKTFAPDMVLKVLPPILVKTVIHILKGDLHQSLAALDAYCQFYWLFMKLINLFPELQEKIDKEAERFLNEEEFRHKRGVGDLGEFMFKLSLSKYSIYNTEMNLALLKESLTRQVSWAKGRDKDLRKEGVENLVEKYMKAATISCQFFLVQLETTKLMINDLVRAELEEGYGVVNPVLLESFKEKMNWIRNDMNNDWRVLINNIGLEEVISNQEKMQEILENAFEKEEETYSRWSAVKCSVKRVSPNDPSLPLLGFELSTDPEIVLIPELICKDLIDTKENQWLPLYINKRHFERTQNIFDSQIRSIYDSMTNNLDKKDKKDLEIEQITIKVFCGLLVTCLDNLSLEGRLQMNVLRAYLQINWTFWKLLEQNSKMRELLDQEVELFKTRKSYTKSMSWPEWKECSIKLLLAPKGRSDSDVSKAILKEIVKREAKYAMENQYIDQNERFKFGHYAQEDIGLFLIQVMLTKLVLQDRYSSQFEKKNGTLRDSDTDEIRWKIIGIFKERYQNLWKLSLDILELQELITGLRDMSIIAKEVYQEATKEVANDEAWELAKMYAAGKWKEICHYHYYNQYAYYHSYAPHHYQSYRY